MTVDQNPTAPPFVPADLGRFVDVASASFSPDGTVVYYAANTRDGVTATTDTAIWSTELGTGAARLFSPSDAAQVKPVISPDGTTLAFLQGTGGTLQLCVRAVAAGTTQVLTDFPRGVGGVGPAWSPDGSLIAFDATDQPPRDPALPYWVTRPLWRRDGMGLVEDKVTDLYIVPATGGASTRLTDDDGVILSHTWSADGSKLLYSSFAAPDSNDYEIRIVERGTGANELVTRAIALAYGAVAAWTPDGRVVHTTPWSLNVGIDLVVFDPATGTSESRAPGLDGQLFGVLHGGFDGSLLEPSIVVDPVVDAAYVFVQRGGSMVIYRVALSGPISAVPLTDDRASRVPLALAGRTLLTAKTSFSSPANLYALDLATNEEVQVTDVNESWLAETPFEVSHLSFASDDGTDIEGWFLEPVGGTRPHPTVLHIHGGPFAGHGEIFNVDNNLLTSAGYGVLHINFRGGSGYGDAFSECLLGDWGRLDLEDLLHGVEVAVERGLADTDRVASFGLSGGGYLTGWLLTHSDRFRAGIAECPVSDWNAMLASDIAPVIAGWMVSRPGRGAASMNPYIDMSPSTFAAHCSAPLLVIEHESDLRCPVSQGDILYNELQLAGLEVEMLRLPNVPHSPFLGANLVVREGRAEALLGWLDTHLGVSAASVASGSVASGSVASAPSAVGA
jgi:dipeptidyl aminopeptidase/acylaminoacyl peptidase